MKKKWIAAISSVVLRLQHRNDAVCIIIHRKCS